MNIRNSLTLTRRYKAVTSAIHTVYRLINSTYDLKNLLLRLARLISSLLEAQSCAIVILDPTQKRIVLRCATRGGAKCIVYRNARISGRLEKLVLRRSSVVRSKHSIAVPLIADDLVGIIILRPKKTVRPFDANNKEILTQVEKQSVTGFRTLRPSEKQQKIILGS